MTLEDHRVLEDDHGGIKAVTFQECPKCSALVLDLERHLQWHRGEESR
jgi:hypothetical protein